MGIIHGIVQNDHHDVKGVCMYSTDKTLKFTVKSTYWPLTVADFRANLQVKDEIINKPCNEGMHPILERAINRL